MLGRDVAARQDCGCGDGVCVLCVLRRKGGGVFSEEIPRQRAGSCREAGRELNTHPIRTWKGTVPRP